ncbi:hypothetical protein ACFRCX_25030 [Streptomyces sp. NPDC056652]|uniref:hypothetical protein n=1 Tax=Streptomyces sp. NPDC056652 TaxID=3345893 RepID=UPI0036895E49
MRTHDSADVPAAGRFRADVAGIGIAALGKTTPKRRNPKTVRTNVGDDYHGCFVVRVSQSPDMYRRIEGWWYGIVGAALTPDPPNRA